jgi:hypothetical protein
MFFDPSFSFTEDGLGIETVAGIGAAGGLLVIGGLCPSQV